MIHGLSTFFQDEDSNMQNKIVCQSPTRAKVVGRSTGNLGSLHKHKKSGPYVNVHTVLHRCKDDYRCIYICMYVKSAAACGCQVLMWHDDFTVMRISGPNSIGLDPYALRMEVKRSAL